MKSISKALILGMLAICLATGLFAQKTKWSKFETPQFSAMLPGSPEQQFEGGDKEGTGTTKYTIQSENKIYMIAVTNTGMVMDNPEEMADVAASAFSESIGMEELEVGKWEIQGIEGRYVHYQNEERDAHVEYHVVAKSQFLYQLAMVSDAEQPFGSKEAKKLIKGFKIK